MQTEWDKNKTKVQEQEVEAKEDTNYETVFSLA